MRKLLIGLTKIWKLLFKEEKALKATNEMKPVEMDKYIGGVDEEDFLDNTLRVFVHKEYWKITKKWHKSPKNYYLWFHDDGSIDLLKFEDNPARRDVFRSLYEWYNIYNGKKDNN